MDPAEDSPESPPPAPPPPPHPTTKRSYAAASSSPSAVRPPPVPPKPASGAQGTGTSPVAATSFFGSSAAVNANAPTGANGAFRPARPTGRSPSHVRSALHGAEDSTLESDDELLLRGAAVPPAPLKKRSPPVVRTYGSGSGSGSGGRRERRVEDAQGGQKWEDEWVRQVPPPVPSPPAAVRDAAENDPGVWGGASWEEVVRAHQAAPASVRVERASPSPPVAPPPVAGPKLLEWASPSSPVGMPLDAWWSTPRVLALEGEPGAKPALWRETVWDFELADTPAGEAAAKDVMYLPMGTWVNVRTVGAGQSSESSQATAVDDTVMAVAEDKPLPPVDAAESTPPSTLSSPPPAPPPKPATPPPPAKGFTTITHDELALARPHPHLYFCPRTFSWALFAPLVRPSPDAAAATLLWNFQTTCDPSRLAQYFADRFEALAALHAPPLPIPPADRSKFSAEHDVRTEENVPAFEALEALVELQSGAGDAVVAVSGTGFYPAVIPAPLWDRLMRRRAEEPALGKTLDDAKWAAARCIWRALDHVLFGGEVRMLKVHGKGFTASMPWDAVANDIFIATLGFRLTAQEQLRMPHLDAADEAGRENRMRLLRCWLEIGLWMMDFAKTHPELKISMCNTRITLKPAKPALLDAMGGDDLPRAPQFGGWSLATSSRTVVGPSSNVDALANDYTKLGATPDLADSVIARLYDLQLERDAQHVPIFLEALIRIADGRDSAALQEKVAIERSLDRYPANEVVDAFAGLRLENPYRAYVSEEQIIDAFEKRNTEVTHPERRRVLFEQAKVIATHTGSELLKAFLESMGDEISAVGAGPTVKPRMDLDAANRALGIETDMDDGTISTLYEIRLADASSDTEKAKMREALEVIADARKSSELRTLAQTGKRDDESGWQAGPAVDTNLPVGLTNIANTCYLNSLLQYFFTVREVRDTILAFQDTPTPPAQQAQLRVGGRLVSLAEVKRSKRFVQLLQTLYQQLIHAPVSAVTPETELAYLALVPSKEEAEALSAPAVSATLTEEPEPVDDEAPAEAESVRSSATGSVLGKRKNGEEGATDPASPTETPGDMQLDQGVMPLSSPSVASGGTHLASLSLSSVGTGEDAEMADPDGGEARRAKRGKSEEDRSGASSVTVPQGSPVPELDEAMMLDASPEEGSEGGPPPLPPRRTPLAPSPPESRAGAAGAGSKDQEKELERQVSSYMSFGRQNDVTECMDNVMFQVEAALLANAANGQAHKTTSLLRRTFYGTMRQQLVFDDPSSVPDPIRTQDEPFSSLLVDVAPSASTSSGILARDIYDGLDAVFAPSPITLEGHAAQRRVALVAPPPPVLQIQLQRVQYDREKQSVYKSNAHLQFYEEIGVKRYVEVAEGDVEGTERARRTGELRAELERTRELLAQLTKDKSTNTATVLRSASAHSSQLASGASDSPFGLPPSLTDLLINELFEDTEAEAAALEAEIEALQHRVGEVRAEIERVWEGVEEGTRYELTAVFIHRGTALSGHYYIYQRDHRNPQRWLRYNDSVVSEVDKDEVFRETTGDTNAYFLAYVRKDCRDAIESIKREP